MAVSKPGLAAAGWGSGGNGIGSSTEERSWLGSHRHKSCLTLCVTQALSGPVSIYKAELRTYPDLISNNSYDQQSLCVPFPPGVGDSALGPLSCSE